ncbi:MAG: hypothetical protein H0W72_10915 [Planctomycetes bacterium]|nr:hypothetical protein [Planctomycetota bacterium]
MSAAVLPLVDVWVGTLRRRDPDLLAIDVMTGLVRARRVLLLGWVRQELLTRTRDDAHASRLASALQAYPDAKLTIADQVEAARLTRSLRTTMDPAPVQTATWAFANRIGALLWTEDGSWQQLAPLGLPLFVAL